MKSIEGKCVLDFTFKKKYQAITLQTKPVCVNGEPEIAKVDPKPLFQRLIVAAESIYIYEDKKEIFVNELSSQPISTFNPSEFIHYSLL